MCFSSPTAPAPPPPVPQPAPVTTVQRATQDATQQRQRAARQTTDATKATGALGDTSTATTYKAKLGA